MRVSSLRLCLAAGLGLAATVAVADAASYQEGEHYRRLPIAVETRDPSRIEVVELFSYACIHCYRLEPMLQTWLRTQDEDVDFHRLPLVTSRLQGLAQAYFTAEALDVLHLVHEPIFTAIHEYGINMSRRDHIRRLFVREAGVAEQEFLDVFDSFGVRNRVRQANAQGRAYRITSTPTLVVNGRYVVDTVKVGSQEAMFLVANYLIAGEREAATP